MTPPLMAATTAITIPYDFEVIDFSGSGAETLNFSLLDTELINTIGSITLTLWSILESANILVIMTVVIVALAVLWWLFSIVMGRVIVPVLNVSGLVNAGADVFDVYIDTQNFYLDQELERMEARHVSHVANSAYENDVKQLSDRRQLNSRRAKGVRSGASAFRKISRLR